MSKKRLFKILTIFLVLFAGLFCFYKFMTYDRNYTWAKMYKDELTTIAKKYGFKVGQTNKINITEIKRSDNKNIKIKIQKGLSKINLMTYGHEFGESTKLTSENADASLNFKGWCLDDHLIGLEIEHSNIEDTVFANFKDMVEKQFDNYTIIWTRL